MTQDYKLKSKSWTFTINNPTEKDVQWMKDIECNYIIGGSEIGEEGTPHIQGFITFKRTYSLAQLKKVHKQAHWEIAQCTDAANYCMKDMDYYLRDERKKKGQRTDLKTAYTCVEEKQSLATYLSENKPNLQCIKVFEIAKVALSGKRDFKPFVKWLWGPTGTGKTRQVVEKEPDLWISGEDLKWWDGYESQEAVLIDDFRSDQCTFAKLLRIIDRYPLRVQVKGGSRELVSRRMYITSCYPPEEVYRNSNENINQLLRRIDEVVYTGTDTGTENRGEER
nr:MAG: replication associated protein [Cressdnaviricota sp.]